MRRPTARALVLAVLLGACAGESAGSQMTSQTASPVPSVDTTSAVPTATPTPTSIGPFRFAVIGDFGSGDAAQIQVAERMCAWREKHPYDVVVTTGDNVYPDGAPERFDDAFFEPYECLLSNGVRFHASLGNHDVQTDDGRPELEEEVFGFDGRDYVVRLGGVRFVIADSNHLDRAWLRGALRTQAGDRWTVVAFHHPVYSPGTGHGSTPGFRPDLPRLFRRRGVDLVLNGHDHVFAVTRPLRKIRYVVTGGGGAGLYGCDDAWFSDYCVPRHHFVYVVAHPDRIVVRVVPAAGRVLYSFTTTGRT